MILFHFSWKYCLASFASENSWSDESSVCPTYDTHYFQGVGFMLLALLKIKS